MSKFLGQMMLLNAAGWAVYLASVSGAIAATELPKLVQPLPSDSASDVPPATLKQPDKSLTPLETSLSRPANHSSLLSVTGSTLERRISSSPLASIPAAEPDEPSSMDQVNSVSQLSDVQPSDWAFQALQSLVERYGCIAGYPDKTYRGDRALSRYEFAAGLNACMDRVNELIAAGTADLVKKEDLATLQKLQDQFAAELATLRGRVDSLEARATKLEAQQFSTTTKLNGLVFFNLTGAAANGDVKVEAASLNTPLPSRPAFRNPATGKPFVQTVTNDPEITFSALAWLSLTTSFTGKDYLTTLLAAGNSNSPANVFTSAGLYNSYGVPLTDQGSSPNVGSTDLTILELSYTFPLGDKTRIVVGPRVNWDRYFDNNRFTFFLNGANSFNSYRNTLVNAVNRGSGAIALWQPSKQIRLAVGYLGENTEYLPSSLFNSSSNPRQGLFGGTNTLTTELTLSPSQNFNLRLLYNRTNIQAVFGQIGGAVGAPIKGYADDGAGGPLGNATADTFAVNFDWLVTPKFGLFGRYGYGSTHIDPGDINAQSFQVGVAFPDLGRRGAQATVSFVVPFDVLEGRRYLVSGGGNGGMQYEVNASYFYPLSYNFALVPSFYMIANPNNFDNNPTIFVGHLRTMFSF